MIKEDSALYETRELDVLPYYYRIAHSLFVFLKKKRIASKIHLPNFFFLKRGSNSRPLYIADFSAVSRKMLKLRKNHLKDVKDKINKKQELVWTYFPPRKMVQFFYATNNEGAGNPIERIFIDIDRRKHSAEDARKIALNLINIIKNDKEFNSLVRRFRFVVLWTGASFHVYILLKRPVDLEFYNKYLSYGRNKADSFIMKWAKEIEAKTQIPVRAGHEKSDKFITLDSSNTPSGKLARAPFSLHIKDWKNIDGVCVPVSEEELKDKRIIKNLKSLTPDDVLKDLNRYKRFL